MRNAGAADKGRGYADEHAPFGRALQAQWKQGQRRRAWRWRTPPAQAGSRILYCTCLIPDPPSVTLMSAQVSTLQLSNISACVRPRGAVSDLAAMDTIA